jgi:hypothetical protein
MSMVINDSDLHPGITFDKFDCNEPFLITEEKLIKLVNKICDDCLPGEHRPAGGIFKVINNLLIF